jgi:hypothetical protein
MPYAVMRNIDRCYRALGIYGDPDCEAYIIDGTDISVFRRDASIPVHVIERNRDDILMTGHRTHSDPRPTFCNACNISMVNAFGLAASHRGGADIIVTGDSRREQRAYLLWVNRLSEQFNLPRSRSRGFSGFLSTLDGIAVKYATDIHGAKDKAFVHQRRVASDVPAHLEFFSIYDDTDYASGDHWSLLTEFLGFEFDELAFSFTESDCANPLLMAHLRGLKAEHLFGRTYEDGIKEYVEFAVELMGKKDFPAPLIELVRRRYVGVDGIQRMRALASKFAREAFHLTEAQLVCMVYSPFVNRAANLDLFLEREHPNLIPDVHAIRALLAAPTSDGGDEHLVHQLETLSGLRLWQLQTIFACGDHHKDVASGRIDLIKAILQRDPHKKTIQTRHQPHGPLVQEVITGR